MFKIGLIGYGYWGPNLARNFDANPDLELAIICDFSQDRLEKARLLYPQAMVTTNPEDIFNNKSLDAVAVATPVSKHFELAKKAIIAGKHLWIEKPMTENVGQGEEIIELAEKNKRVLFVDHTFVYTGAVEKMKELIDKGDLGELIYYDSTRANLGLFQQDVDVIWDLAPHDISIMDYLMPAKKLAVSATGSHFYGDNIVPKALLTIYMENKLVAHINVSWLSPVKVRDTFICGTSKMIFYNDNDPSEKVKVYDKGVDLYETKEAYYQLKVQYRVGDMYAPKLKDHEALKSGAQHFVDSIKNNKKPITDGAAGLEVVKILAASKESLQKNGAPVEIG